ncbi:acyl-CoA/acyl-ACP dehydrogenase [Amycolatopsis acidiphila]|uniref:Acyl-CoA dehydrogenase n=1 Tax=Amycolatopsis acidiphila TaxID=715473 RepID=A0A558AEX6_9PSEU|nr:acyl-CoA dehydrogenase family protein [Amycolatopsis acidiphila]TVT22819.1 acyl-CoA dehydrogenase [Amycolatopsis acidiphila]UIJ58168.1 acyl-CoA/acyl-ACP dehydrogenase [Amycolatopsis acidiphila]GHG69668.1 acyl-CoA dehydrogenase [Amycolatopsis acidiphila]
MKFLPSREQTDFAESVDHLLAAIDLPAVIHAWSAGEHGPGLKVWRRLAELGVTALSVPERYDGLGATAVDLVITFERLGYHAVPGPWVETVAVLPALLDDEVLYGVSTGETVASIAAPPEVPYALDADIADLRVFVRGHDLHVFTPGNALSSVDESRRLFEAEPGDQIGTTEDVSYAFDLGALATAAQLLGAGQWLLDTSVSYALQRHQYGRPIGQYQSIKHLLADVATKLELARPLVHGAAVAERSATRSRDVSAAKVAAADAAYLAARTGLQVHGAIGYTAEHPLGLRLTKVRALLGAWGTPAFHRARLLRELA